jgi:hypothetical protein
MQSVDKYVGVFEEGKIWIYKNRVGTKTDSLYISNYYQKPGEYTDNFCNKWYEKQLIFRSNLMSERPGEMYYVANETGTSARFSFGNITFDFRAYAMNDSVILSVVDIDEGSIFREDSLITSIGKVYKDVINVNNQYWFAEGIGIIQYLSIFSKNDTLCLINNNFSNEENNN